MEESNRYKFGFWIFFLISVLLFLIVFYNFISWKNDLDSKKNSILEFRDVKIYTEEEAKAYDAGFKNGHGDGAVEVYNEFDGCLANRQKHFIDGAGKDVIGMSSVDFLYCEDLIKRTILKR